VRQPKNHSSIPSRGKYVKQPVHEEAELSHPPGAKVQKLELYCHSPIRLHSMWQNVYEFK